MDTEKHPVVANPRARENEFKICNHDVASLEQEGPATTQQEPLHVTNHKYSGVHQFLSSAFFISLVSIPELHITYSPVVAPSQAPRVLKVSLHSTFLSYFPVVPHHDILAIILNRTNNRGIMNYLTIPCLHSGEVGTRGAGMSLTRRSSKICAALEKRPSIASEVQASRLK
ncbi:hypothetical protein M427DRAFT_132341 [Gonapodya prolifera JEL478]|uniref:Uncharacterized protein n=1 Tax=Gonapodya prolifera (strain JEL478) TaxID=1344416 RepID=A0A139APW8_GONPJ|nr:hypothetical protein M427DRAFT_132341 [Gonapodya prolifera JEL478]|eukprot:KXS18797.1 hypothetical protein M427DRAFT_132341 [Gonapodya prolifera JEL478]